MYEWEDVISRQLELKIVEISKYIYDDKIARVPFSKHILLPRALSLCFEMSPVLSHNITNKANIVPWIIDFYLDKSELPKFYRQYSKNPLTLISSKEVFQFLKENDCPIPIAHLPLSISDIYRTRKMWFVKKKYDLVLMGRQNPILYGFLDRYLEHNPDLYYVYRKKEGNQFNYYTSRGEYIGDINTRERYINLMCQARIGLYSTPGTDDTSGRTKGFSQVTPRLLEYLCCGCHVISRYITNADTDYFELGSLSPSIETYEQFEVAMDTALKAQVDSKLYGKYLSKHYTSVRAEQLKNILEKL